MLILTRKVGEKIVINNANDAVVVTVLESKGNQVRIGVEAPHHIEVDREEIRQRKIDNPNYDKN